MIIFNLNPLQCDVFLSGGFFVGSPPLSTYTYIVTLPNATRDVLWNTNKARTRKRNGERKKRERFHSAHSLETAVARNSRTNLSRNTCHSTRSVGVSCLPRNSSTPYTCDGHDNRNSRTRYTQFLLRMRRCIMPIDGIRTKRTEYRFLG